MRRFAWVLLVLLLPTAGADGLVEIDAEEASAIDFALRIDLDTGAVSTPSHVVELFTAAWCLPCRAAEAEATAIGADVAVIELHSSNFSDEAYLPAARDRWNTSGAEGYPTFVVDNRWSLLSRAQSREAHDLVAALTPLEEGVDANASREGGVIRVELGAHAPTTLDIWVIDGTTAIAGRSDLASNGSALDLTIAMADGQAMLDADHVLIVGRAQTDLRPASTTPIFDGVPAQPAGGPWRALLIGGLLLMMLSPALVGTARRLPVLMRVKRDEEE